MSLTWLCILILTTTGGGGELAPVNETSVEIVALYPNPVAYQDRGEFILVEVSGPMRTDHWRFVDDAGQEALPPPMIVNGSVAFSFHPDEAAPYVDAPVFGLEGWLQLADAGQTLELRIDGEVADRVSYEGPAPRARLWVRDATPEPWVPVGATAFEPVDATAAVTAFVLPDAAGVPTTFLEGAHERILLGGYTLSDPEVVEALLDAHRRGIDVRVHVDGRPVGGISIPMGDALDRLDAAGINVTVHRGPYARWGFHHPKYAVVDDRVLVTTENWNPSGTGGRASRGWGVIVESAALADELTAVFEADTTWKDAQSWGAIRDELARHEDDSTLGSFPPVHDPEVRVDTSVTMIAAPDNAEAYLERLIRNATQTVDIKQVRIGDVDFPLLQAAIDAARDGVRVRILLAGAWYVEEDNTALAETLDDIAETEGLDLEVRLVGRNEHFDRLHAKGVIVDERYVAVSSINWNNHSIRQNREIGVVIDDEAVGAYFTAVFEADWTSDAGLTLPIELILVTLLALGILIYHATQMHFEGAEAAAEETHTER